jgi:glycosyltransferase involved in cell wall biosynthesis
MKILFPTRIFYPSQTGGPANSIYFLAKSLVKNGIKVYVLATTLGIKDLSSIELDKWIKLDGINVYYSNKYFHNLIPKNLFNINIPEIDIIHFSSFFDPFNIYYMLLSRKRNLNNIFSPRGELQPSALSIKSSKKRLFMNNFFIKKIMKKASFHVTSESEMLETKNYLKKIKSFENKIFNIPNIMEFNEIESVKYENRYDFKYILYLGRISRIKNIELLIDVYDNLNIDKNIKLIIAGDVNDDFKYYEELKNKVIKKKLDENIIFTQERIEGEEKSSLYYNAELFILPSKSENFGMVVLESLIKGTPVVATKGTPWESLNNNNCGYWVEMELNSLKNAIENYFLLSDDDKNDMKKRCIILAKEFSSEKLIDKYIKMYKEII